MDYIKIASGSIFVMKLSRIEDIAEVCGPRDVGLNDQNRENCTASEKWTVSALKVAAILLSQSLTVLSFLNVFEHVSHSSSLLEVFLALHLAIRMKCHLEEIGNS